MILTLEISDEKKCFSEGSAKIMLGCIFERTAGIQRIYSCKALINIKGMQEQEKKTTGNHES